MTHGQTHAHVHPVTSAMANATDWIGYDGWLAIVGALAAAACAIPGTFLMLRRMSLMGDAISHAVLPGLVLAYMISESRAGLPMLVGAVTVGLFAAVATETLRRLGKVDESASIGVVFTTLFAVGLVLINYYASSVDIDPNCVLNGNLELVPLDTYIGTQIPRPAVELAFAFVLNLGLTILLYKEFKLSSFDPALAATLGFRPAWMHYLLMTMTALTCVVAFEAVGSILVIALLIVPAAAAHLLTDRLRTTLILAVAIGVAAALVGQFLATSIPGRLGLNSVSITGTTASLTGVILAGAIVCSPKHGVIARVRRRAALGRQIAREDVLGALYRADEIEPVVPISIEALARLAAMRGRHARSVVEALARAGMIKVQAAHATLTDTGRREAQRVLRSHRLWETYLADVANVAPDHTHARAHRLEHVPGLAERLSDEMCDPASDPHKKPIPRRQ